VANSESTHRWIYVFEAFVLDARRRTLRNSERGRVPVKSKAFDTLLYFVEHRGEPLSKAELLDVIWPNLAVEERELDETIAALRRRLGG